MQTGEVNFQKTIALRPESPPDVTDAKIQSLKCFSFVFSLFNDLSVLKIFSKALWFPILSLSVDLLKFQVLLAYVQLQMLISKN